MYECLYKLSEGALKGAAEALRLAAKLLGLGREASPSAAASLKEFFVSTYIYSALFISSEGATSMNRSNKSKEGCSSIPPQ